MILEKNKLVWAGTQRWHSKTWITESFIPVGHEVTDVLAHGWDCREGFGCIDVEIKSWDGTCRGNGIGCTDVLQDPSQTGLGDHYGGLVWKHKMGRL